MGYAKKKRKGEDRGVDRTGSAGDPVGGLGI